MTRKIGMGGGCHWCTEAVFQSLKGVLMVEQGYFASTGDTSELSEGVLIHFQPEKISLHTLIEIHLLTHRSTSEHSFRKKYRSAIYFMEPGDENTCRAILRDLQQQFEEPIITQVLPFSRFEASRPSLRDYYFSDPEKPFCQRYIKPKIRLLLERFGKEVDLHKLDMGSGN